MIALTDETIIPIIGSSIMIGILFGLVFFVKAYEKKKPKISGNRNGYR